MDIKGFVPKIIPEINSPSKVYDLFRGLGYPEDKVLDPTNYREYAFVFPKFEATGEGKHRLKLTILNLDGLVKSPLCHPELVSGSRNLLILLDAETSSA